jgi:hypothetical protein
MAVAHKDSRTAEAFPFNDLLDAVRSEPAAAWFLAQALWIAQPVLGIFWAPEKISEIAGRLEGALDTAGSKPPADAGAAGRGHSG